MGAMKYFSAQPTPAPDGAVDHYHNSPNGLPTRVQGAPPILRQDELEERTHVNADFHCRTFLTWDAQDEVEYAGVMDRIANGVAWVYRRLEHYDEANSGWRIRLEWLTGYNTIAAGPPRPGG